MSRASRIANGVEQKTESCSAGADLGSLTREQLLALASEVQGLRGSDGEG